MMLTSRNRLDGGGMATVRGVDPGLLLVGLLLPAGASTALTVDVVRTGHGLKGDEATYVAMALSSEPAHFLLIPGVEGRVELNPSGVHTLGRWAYLLSVRTSAGFIPKLLVPGSKGRSVSRRPRRSGADVHPACSAC